MNIKSLKHNLFTDFISKMQPEKIIYSVLDNIPVGLEIYNRDGKLMYINAEALHAIKDSDINNTPGVNLFDNRYLPKDKAKLLKEGEDVEFSVIIDIHPDKSTCPNDTRALDIAINVSVDDNGEIEHYILISQDVTEKRNKDLELQLSKLKTEISLRASGTIMWEFDTETMMFTTENEPIVGGSASMSVDEYLSITHPDDIEQVEFHIDKMVKGENFTFSFDSRILYPNTTECLYCTNDGLPFETHKSGRVLKYIGTRKNNTDLYKQKELRDKILNDIPLSIHIKDVADNYRYTFCNAESRRMFNTEVNMICEDVLSREQADRLHKTDMQVYESGESYLGIERLVLKDGREYETIVRKSIIYDSNKRLLLNVRWDKGLQNELERHAKILSLSFKAVNAFSWYYEPNKNKMTYSEGSELIRDNLKDYDTFEKIVSCIHPDDRNLFSDSINEIIKNKTGDLEIEFRACIDGSNNYEWWQSKGIIEKVIREDVEYLKLYGMTINIDSQKKIELDLIGKKEELNKVIKQKELVLNNANSGLVYITPDYIVQWENLAACHASLSYEAYRKGERCFETAHGRSTPCEDCVMQRAFKSREVEHSKFKLDNNHTIEVFATPVFSEDNDIEGVVVRIDDITKREMALQAIEYARKTAEESDKLKSAFLANMSHEIRTPLNAIIGFSELLMTTEEEAEKEEYIKIINNNNSLLLKLISDILDLSKIEAGVTELKFEKFDFSEYFNDVATSMKIRLKNHDIKFKISNPHQQCMVELDKNSITQIILNYTTNAIKYTQKGFIELGYETNDAELRIYVRDSGIGIADEKKDKVFRRFEKIDEFAQGTGLGLSICKAIAESMNGTVGFESQEDEGSIFWASIPCHPKTIQSNITDNTTNSNNDYNKNDIIVLVAEDNSSNYKLVGKILNNGYKVIRAENGQEAVEIARLRKPAIVLMDIKMPVMNGVEATEEIRKFDKKTPIIMLTAHAFEADKRVAFAAGCNDYLTKPINRKELLSVIEKYTKR